MQTDQPDETPFKSVQEWKQDKVTALFFKLGDSVSDEAMERGLAFMIGLCRRAISIFLEASSENGIL